MDKRNIELLKKNAPTVFNGFASLRIKSLTEEIQLLRNKYLFAPDTEKPFIVTKANELKEDLAYYQNYIDALNFS